MGFERGPAVFRFEPSGTIKIGDTYHVYYTRFSPFIVRFDCDLEKPQGQPPEEPDV